VTNFLGLAESADWRPVFLGFAVLVDEMISAAQREGAEMVDYWRRGRTMEKLGLAEWSVSELTRFVQEGKLD
jgi:hypothetical protein